MVRLLHFLLLSANCGGPGGHGGVQYPWVSSPSSTLPLISKLPTTAVFPPSFNYLLHSNNVPINPISNVEQVSVGEIDLGNVTGCFLFVPSCTWGRGKEGGMIGDMQSFKCKQSKMGLVDRHQAFLPKRQFSSWLLGKVKKEDDYVEEGS